MQKKIQKEEILAISFLLYTSTRILSHRNHQIFDLKFKKKKEKKRKSLRGNGEEEYTPCHPQSLHQDRQQRYWTTSSIFA
jgi:hypothetical protein